MSSPTRTRTAQRRGNAIKKSAAAPQSEPRGARRKRETRQRLLHAALRLMAQKGMEGVAINEITEAADVGFGSFYNHFASKEVIHAALVDEAFETFADTLDAVELDTVDAAEVLAISIRHTILRAQREPLWAQLLIREGFSTHALERGLGQRLLRDIQKGIDAKRFVSHDPLMAFIAVAGTVLSAVSVLLDFGPRLRPQLAALAKSGFSVDSLPERAATMALTTLGIALAEANKIARRPLPPLKNLAAAERS